MYTHMCPRYTQYAEREMTRANLRRTQGESEKDRDRNLGL